MQHELDAENLPVEVRILGVNAAGEESQNDTICSGRDLPWLQDTVADSVWTHWDATWRDVIILDPENKSADVYNLTSAAHNLANADSYAALKALIRAAAGATTP